MNKIRATCIKNPFQPRLAENKEEREFDYKDQNISDVFCQFYPIPSNDVSIVASINGVVYENAKWDTKLNPGDHLVFVPIPKGGGGGSNVMAVLAMVVVAAIAWHVAPMLASATMAAVAPYATVGGGLLTGMFSAAIMIGGGMLVSSIFPTPKLGIEKGDLSESSPTYGWSTFNNSSQEGTALPIIIGERKVAPPIISAHAETIDGVSYLSLLYAVSEGPIESITGIEINEQPVSFYNGIEVHTRLGDDNQDIIPTFNDIYSDSQVNAVLTRDDYIIRKTSGTGLDAVQVHISLPMGLWYANNKGKMVDQTLSLSILYRKFGETSWNVYTPAPEELNAVAYSSNTVYNPGETVLYNSNYYKCTNYKVEVSDESGTTIQYITSLKYNFLKQNQKTTLPTPPPPNEDCWQLVEPSATSLSITSNSNSPIDKTYRINFPIRGQYEIACKVTDGPPEGNSRYGSKAVWAGLTEIINDDLVYPGTALLGLKIKATDQISGGIPKVTCIAKKTSHTFPTAGTVDLTNPAWGAYYVLNNSAWGGGISEDRIKTQDFESWASFCETNELKSCFYIDQRMTYNDIKNYFCEIGRANIVQYGINFGVIIDKQDIPTQLFTIGNIIKDSFKMDYLPMDDRANVIRIHYYDKEYNWEKSTLEVRTDNFITGNNEKAQEMTLYACDDRNIAERHAILLLNYNKHLLRTCSFNASIDALACSVGDIILVQQDLTHYGHGGRLVEIDGTHITLDRKIELKSGATYGLIVRDSTNDEIIKKTFAVSTDGFYDEINISSTLPTSVKPHDVYSVGEETIEAKPFRVISISREEDFVRKIVALEYYDEVYNDIEVVDNVKDYSYMILPVVSGLSANEIIDHVFSKYTKIRLSWKCNSSYGVKVTYSFNDGTYRSFSIPHLKENFIEIDTIPVGIPIEFRVEPLNNSDGYSIITETFWAEENVIYESNCYVYDVFANQILQDSVGEDEPFTMWLQEPQNVNLEFID